MARVLVVDDERGIRYTLREFLKASGHEVHLAANVSEGRAVLSREAIDVVVLDVVLPKESGLTLLEHIHDSQLGVETIMMTGEPNIEITVAAMRLGAFDFLAKPVSGASMMEVVAQAAQRKAEREATHRALAESEARFQRLAENAPDMIWRVDDAGVFTYVNQASSKILGYPPEECIGCEALSFLAPESSDDLSRWMLKAGKGLPGKDQISTRVVHRHADGHDVPCEVNAAIVRNDQGWIVAVEGITRDITKRERAEARLRESERLYSMALNRATDMIFVTSADGVVQFLNEPARRHYDVEDLEVVSDFALDIGWFWCGEDIEQVRDAVARVLETRQPASVDCRCGDDEYELVLAPVEERGEVHRIVAVARDVTERKRVMAHLRESEERFRQAVASSPMGIVLVEQRDDGERIVTGVNTAASRALGVSSADLVGRSPQAGLPAPFAEEISKRLPATFATARDWELLLDLRDPDGNGKVLEVRLFRTTPGRAAIELRDITDRRLAEEARERSERRLRQVRRLEAIGHLAAGIALDMNNFLGAIMVSAAVVGREVDPEGPGARDVENILAACRRGRDLTRTLLRFSTREELELEVLDVAELVQQTRELLAHAIPESVTIASDIDEDVMPIEGDASRLGQALIDVCLNAVEAMPDGGTVTIGAYNVELDEEEHFDWGDLPPGRYVALEVCDSGQGMTPDVIERAFEPFFTTKEGDENAGLGLSVVYGTVRGHGGTAHLRSDDQVGARVTLLLPAHRDRATEPPKAKERDDERGGAGVLVVDDEYLIRYSARRLLEKLGYHVLEASDGNEALRVYRTHQREVDLVILDLVMPSPDGHATFRKLREIDPDVKVLVASGYISKRKIEELTNEGVLGCIEKPYDFDKMAQTVAGILSAR